MTTRWVRYPALLWFALTAAIAFGADPVERLQQRLDAGEVQLEYDAQWGYLPALLRAFDISVASQTLVFSKTSAQFRLISSDSPRALYFNDDVYVGFVRGGPFLEISAADPEGGGVFYALDQTERKSPRFSRDNGQCLQCHESGRTQRVPGHITRSVYPDAEGQPFFGAGSTNVDHTTPIEERFGGWYVTGTLADSSHRGNAVVNDPSAIEEFEAGPGSQLTRLDELIDTSAYLTPHSDMAAHLILAHQTQMHNYIAKAGIEARNALKYGREMERVFGEVSTDLKASVKRRIEGPSEKLLRHLLFVDEARLTGEVRGTSTFAQEFPLEGPHDAKGRSLRDLDLTRRIFRYPCSFLIYSEAFASLPAEVKSFVFARLAEVLEGRDTSGVFDHLSESDRTAIREILLETLAGFRS